VHVGGSLVSYCVPLVVKYGTFLLHRSCKFRTYFAGMNSD